MKSAKPMRDVQERMAPGVLSAHGFLGSDRRALAAIIDDDAARVRRLGLAHDGIARRMEELRDAGARGLGDFVAVAPHFEVRVDCVRGKIPCPFGDRALERKGFTVVRNLATGREITYTDLGIHMIRAHGFYEGTGSPFRLDPEALAEVLEVRPSAALRK